MAISPMYAAPEGIFVGSAENKSPHAFDVYSGGLIFCQLLFNLFDDLTSTNVTGMTATPFYQQLKEAHYDLDLWLSTRSFSKSISEEEQNHISSDLLAGLAYLSRKPGLWSILKNTLQANPEQRYTANEVLQKFYDIQKRSTAMDHNEQKMMQGADGAYFLSVMRNLKLYENNNEDGAVAPVSLISSRSLHFVATFDNSQSLGLTLTSSGGDVFVHGIIKGGQAETMDCRIEVGDRLVGVGETPVYGGSFDKVINMVRYSVIEMIAEWARSLSQQSNSFCALYLHRKLSNYPKSDKTITLHFDRTSLSKLKANLSFLLKEKPNMVKVVDHGAWSSLGERCSQEDSLRTCTQTNVLKTC
jgi:serine/threonine protein kinase